MFKGCLIKLPSNHSTRAILKMHQFVVFNKQKRPSAGGATFYSFYLFVVRLFLVYELFLIQMK